MKEFTVSSLTLQSALSGLYHRGITRQRIAEFCGLREKVLYSKRISVLDASNIIRKSRHLIEDEGLALLESPVPLGHFRLKALLCSQMPNLREAFNRYIEFQNLYRNSFTFSLDTAGYKARLILNRVPGHRIFNEYALDSALTVIFRFLGWLCGSRLTPTAVSFDVPPPQYVSEHRYMYFGAPITYATDQISVDFDRKCLGFPVIQDLQSTEEYARRAPLDVFLSMSAVGKYTEIVQHEVINCLSRGDLLPELKQFSSLLGFHSQTLRRHLQAEGTSFQEIKNQIRRDIAIHLLGQMDFSIEEISAKSGYSEPSAFVRAFKGWTGISPLQFRKTRYSSDQRL